MLQSATSEVSSKKTSGHYGVNVDVDKYEVVKFRVCLFFVLNSDGLLPTYPYGGRFAMVVAEAQQPNSVIARSTVARSTGSSFATNANFL